jgi:hypothetical protein
MRPTVLIMSLDIQPFRTSFIRQFKNYSEYVETNEFAIQVMYELLISQIEAVVGYGYFAHNGLLRPYVRSAVNEVTQRRSYFRPLNRTFINAVDYQVDEIRYRRSGNRFVIKGTYE